MAFLGIITVHDTAKITVKTVTSSDGVARWYRIMVDDVVLATVFHTNGTKGELPEIVFDPPVALEVAA